MASTWLIITPAILAPIASNAFFDLSKRSIDVDLYFVIKTTISVFEAITRVSFKPFAGGQSNKITSYSFLNFSNYLSKRSLAKSSDGFGG